MPPTEPTLDPRAHPEAVETTHPFAELAAAQDAEEDLEILMSREEIDTLQRELD